MPALTTIKVRRGTAAGWTAANPTLAAGEPGYETDTGKMKVGDGATAWNSLAYFYGAGGVTGFATPAIGLGTAAAAGAATTAIRSDSTIAAFDGTVPVTQAFGDAAATGAAAVAARRDHKHGMPATPPGFANPMTTQDDIIVGGTAGAPGRLGKGADGQVLTVDPATHHLLWATPSAGFADPTTTKGDLIVHGTSTTRLGVGTDGQVLTADSTQTLGVKWAAGGGGGGGGGTDYDVSPNPTADDQEFKSALSGWTTLGTPDVLDANATGYTSLLRLSVAAPGTFQVHGVYRAIPAGGMPFTVTARLPDYFAYTNYQAHGLMLTDSTPTKLFTWGPLYQSSYGIPELIAANWNSRTSRGSFTEYAGTRQFPRYLRMVVNSSTSIDLWYSYDGEVWVNQATGWNPGFTIANIGFGITGNDNSVPVSMVADWMRFGTGVVIQPNALLWQNVGGVSDLVKVATGAGTITVPGMSASIDRLPATPNAKDDEFGSLSGWSTLGTLNTDNVTDAASHLHLGNTAIGYAMNGHYKAAPSMPFTVTTKITDFHADNNFVGPKLFLADSTPTALFSYGPLYGNYSGNIDDFVAYQWSNRTTRGAGSNSNLNIGHAIPFTPVYLRLVVHSSTNIDCLVSFNGLSWYQVYTGVSSGLTVANVGLAVAGDTGGGAVDAFFDWIRFS